MTASHETGNLLRDREWGRHGLKASYPRTAQFAVFLEGAAGVLRGTCKGPVVRSLPHTTSFPFSKERVCPLVEA